jgi:oligopeptide/dipeptide ABC transporter ATP-binding protein
MDEQPLLTINNLTTYFFRRDGIVKAVDGVSLELAAGETLGIVGESGSGKSVTALSLLRLVRPPGRIVAGEVLFDGTDLLKVDNARLRQIRGSDIGMIFQDPMSSLNPTLRIGRQVAEPRWWHGAGKREAFQHAVQLLTQVGIPTARSRARDYPFQFSGGMRQRTGIAAAVACTPRLLIADEPTTALDVTVQAQILELIGELNARSGTAIILITHDFGVAAQVCRRIMVMYAGRVAEVAPTDQFLREPAHPYSRGLLSSTPILGRKLARLTSIPGSPPVMTRPPAGCRFHPRCPHAMDRCRVEEPPLIRLGPRHAAACWLHADR